MRRLAVVMVVSLVVGEVSIGQNEVKTSPIEGERHDSHGNLSWRSTAERSTSDRDLWTYRRTVTNREQKLRCATTWEIAKSKWKSLVEPGETAVAFSLTVNVLPEKKDGKLTYNGGKAVGEAIAEAPAWGPQRVGQENLSSKTEATVKFLLDDRLLKIGIVATTDAKRDGANYTTSYRLQLNEKLQSTDTPLNKLPDGVSVRWTSIESRAFLAEMVERPPSPGSTLDAKTKYLALEKGRFAAMFRFKGETELRDGSLQFILTRNREKPEVLAEACLPAFGPTEK